MPAVEINNLSRSISQTSTDIKPVQTNNKRKNDPKKSDEEPEHKKAIPLNNSTEDSSHDLDLIFFDDFTDIYNIEAYLYS